MSSKLKVLVLDDEKDIVELMSEMLEDDFDVEVSTDSEEAFERLSTDTFDVLLTDLTMPKLTAFQLLVKLQGQNVYIPTIIMSGYSEKEMPLFAQVSKYVIQVVEKPIRSFDELKQLIREGGSQAA